MPDHRGHECLKPLKDCTTPELCGQMEKCMPHLGQRHEEERTATDVLGDLIDALSDNLPQEVCNVQEVIDLVREGCTIVGGNHLPYLEGWWLRGA